MQTSKKSKEASKCTENSPRWHHLKISTFPFLYFSSPLFSFHSFSNFQRDTEIFSAIGVSKKKIVQGKGPGAVSKWSTYAICKLLSKMRAKGHMQKDRRLKGMKSEDAHHTYMPCSPLVPKLKLRPQELNIRELPDSFPIPALSSLLPLGGYNRSFFLPTVL